MNRSALKWKLIAWFLCISIGAAAGLIAIWLNYLVDSDSGDKTLAGENWFIFLPFLIFGAVGGFVGVIRMRPRVWD
jgi:hypothetical protein